MQITLAESISGAVQNILHRILQHLQLVAGILRELDFFGVHLFGGFQQIYGMIADALKEAEDIEIDRKRIDLKNPIKTAGKHEVVVSIYRDIKSNLTVVVGNEETFTASESAAEAQETAEEDFSTSDAVAEEPTADAVVVAEVEAE